MIGADMEIVNCGSPLNNPIKQSHMMSCGCTLYVKITSFDRNPKLSNSPLFPILGNPDFPPGLEPGAFGKLKEKRCFQASYFLRSNNWPTIELLMQQGGQYEIPFWQARQIRHFFETLGPTEEYGRPRKKFERYCEKEPLSHINKVCLFPYGYPFPILFPR